MTEGDAIPALLDKVRNGDSAAFDRLLPLVYDRLKQIARRQLRRRGFGLTLSTTELVHETYLKMVPQVPAEWEDRAHFFGVAARAMRQVLVDHARKKNAQKRGGTWQRITLTGQHLAFELRIDELLALDQALDKLDALNERLRKVVELRFFGGMTEKEVAEVLDVSTRTVQRDWTKAKLFLHRELYPDDAP